MLNYLLLKFYRIVVMRIYSDSTVLVMELKSKLDPKSPASIQEVVPDNVEDALSFQSKEQIRMFRSFLQRGDKGFYGYLEGRCVHRSWVVPGIANVSLHKFYSIDLKENEVFIQYCETANEARGRNIFAHVLSNIGEEYAENTVLTSVDSNNTSSIKSMAKAGFEEIYRKRIRIFFGKRIIS